MGRVKEFFLGLSKSTRITLISCGCFVLLTLIILLFFVMFPITPSERAIARIGREGLVYDPENEGVVTTTVSDAVGSETTTTVTTTSTTHSEIRITFTTVSGFFTPGYIQTGDPFVNNYETTTTTTTTIPVEDPSEGTTTETTEPSTEDTSQGTEDPGTEPTEPSTDSGEIPTDPPVTDPPEPATTPPETPSPEEQQISSE